MRAAPAMSKAMLDNDQCRNQGRDHCKQLRKLLAEGQGAVQEWRFRLSADAEHGDLA